MRTLLFACSLAALALVTTGCSEVEGCTMIAVTSVNLELFDGDTGDPIVDADVQYAVDGGEFAPCENWGDDNMYACGVEEAGSFEILIDAEGYESAELDVDIGEDECHVIGEMLVEDLAPVYEAQ